MRQQRNSMGYRIGALNLPKKDDIVKRALGLDLMKMRGK